MSRTAGIRLAAIVRYPVKSCRGIAVDRACVGRRGLDDDRRWMVVDSDGRFVSQREAPRLALVDVALDGERLVLRAPDVEPLQMPARSAVGPAMTVSIWRDRVEARAHDEAGVWMSRVLGRTVRLVYMPDEARRPVDPAYGLPGDVVSFADGYPLLLASASSLRDLVARSPSPIGMERFRPNLVVEGAPPWAEDGWSRLSIGRLSLRAPKPCDRCVVTTIDPSSGTSGPEPLRTLATFRRRGAKVSFGMNLIPDLADDERVPIAVGDAVVPEG